MHGTWVPYAKVVVYLLDVAIYVVVAFYMMDHWIPDAAWYVKTSFCFALASVVFKR